MTARVLLVGLLACGNPARDAEAPHNSGGVTPSRPSKVMGVVVLEEASDCPPAKHHIAIEVDNVRQGVALVECAPPPPPTVRGNLVMTESGDFHFIDGPQLQIADGKHTIRVTDLDTKLSDEVVETFPFRYSDKEPVTDIILIQLHVDWIAAKPYRRGDLKSYGY